MLSLPQQTLTRTKNYLVKQQAQVEEEIKSLETQDPVLVDALAEATEPGTESFQADVHNRLSAAKTDLMDLLKKTKNSLLKMNKGTYGICDKCKKPIEIERLEAVPTASLCIACSKKASKR